jgi:phosphoglucomutase
VRAHWASYGRNFYSRHDYEAVAGDGAAALMDALRAQLPSLAGKALNGLRVNLADDFAYTDPVDGSTASKQGVRVVLEGEARIVFRLSGTGTQGATLRVYLERYEPDKAKYHVATQSALAPLIEIARSLARIEHYTGRTAPSVVT